jgi:benzoyl-CoA reductase/2-hydroxyglutaryl-CoA dehydratase subunit BcrC/BadD/HgdB
MIAFGWSVSDLADAIKVVAKVAAAFKEAGGAASKYQQLHDFAISLKNTLEHLRTYTTLHTDDEHAEEIAEQARLIEKPWKEFHNFLNKYEKSLGERSQRSKLSKAPRVLRWAAKELSGEVQKMEAAMNRPLQSLNMLLSLQGLLSCHKIWQVLF